VKEEPTPGWRTGAGDKYSAIDNAAVENLGSPIGCVVSALVWIGEESSVVGLNQYPKLKAKSASLSQLWVISLLRQGPQCLGFMEKRIQFPNGKR